MLYFYVDSEEKALTGVSRLKFDESRLYRDLKQAKKDSRGLVLVVDAAKTPASLSGEVKKIPASAFLNANPYRKPKEVTAGGGIVTREGKNGLKVLLIYRKKLWDLPKGKLDKGESIKSCAEREVKEELGISEVTVLDLLDTTVHGYVERKNFMVKTTHWYHMKVSTREFVPQAKEKITAVQWFSLAKAKSKLAHKTLSQLLNRVEHQILYTHDHI
ncbi:MAG: NUDIX domain-containing protein [Bacteroidetes bacterium]|nr:NUDIX domain-containing protein [Bacteroidota bacterium]